MRQTDERVQFGRRRFLSGLGVACATIAGGSAVATASDEKPTIGWRQNYDDENYELALQAVQQTDDGGYALAGTGAPVTETGTEVEQFALLQTDASGEKQWIAFANDDTETTTTFSFGEMVQTTDGGYALVGDATDPKEGEDDPVGGVVAEAAKFTADGELDWIERLDAFEQDEVSSNDEDAGNSDNALFLSAHPTDDGGLLAGGTFESQAWLVSFDAAGTVNWEQRYDGFSVEDIWGRDGGPFEVLVDRDAGYRALSVAEDGTVQSQVTLGVDYERTPHNHVFVPTDDGGYAYTGRDRNRENVVLGKLDASGSLSWREEFDGSDEGGDWGKTLVQTDDGGYAVAGYMRTAEAGAITPTVVRTDSDGTEQWRLLFRNVSATDVSTIEQTADGGYACLFGSLSNTVARLDGDTGVPLINGTRPTDPDNDGRYEDIDGDGDSDIFDALAYYNNRDSDAIRNNPALFDFDGDGNSGDLFDAIALYNEAS